MKNYDEIIQQLTNIGWIVNERETYLSIKSKNSPGLLLKLSKQNLGKSLSEDEIYALSTLYAIEDECIEYGWTADNLESHKKHDNFKGVDFLIDSIIVAMDEQVEKLKNYLTKVYFKNNWKTLKPMLEMIVKTSRKDYRVYEDAYKTLCEVCDNYKVSTGA